MRTLKPLDLVVAEGACIGASGLTKLFTSGIKSGWRNIYCEVICKSNKLVFKKMLLSLIAGKSRELITVLVVSMIDGSM